MIVQSSHFWEAPKSCTVSGDSIVGAARQRNRLLGPFASVGARGFIAQSYWYLLTGFSFTWAVASYLRIRGGTSHTWPEVMAVEGTLREPEME